MRKRRPKGSALVERLMAEAAAERAARGPAPKADTLAEPMPNDADDVGQWHREGASKHSGSARYERLNGNRRKR